MEWKMINIHSKNKKDGLDAQKIEGKVENWIGDAKTHSGP